LKRIKETGDIFFAESDRPWVLDGANVHVSMVGFDNGEEQTRILDSQTVGRINPNLTALSDITLARPLQSVLSLGFMGDTKGGAFDIEYGVAIDFLKRSNPHLRPNSDVVVPWVNGLDLTSRNREMWIIDFAMEMPEDEASLYEAPYEYVKEHVFPERKNNNRDAYRLRWWQHVEARSGMRKSFSRQSRFLATARVAKHRLFSWFDLPTLPDSALIAFARSDDYFLGIVHSRPHERWSLELGTRLETRPRYTPSTCFETFPFPHPTDAQRQAIAAAAKELDTLRNNWLNPPELVRTEVLEFPGSSDGPWARYLDPATLTPLPDGSAKVGTVRYPRLVPKDEAAAAVLKKRTLTNLYNQRPTWLDHVHKKLDAAVFAAYGWDPAISDDELLAKLLELNLASA